jgi:ABC-2 type transport system ATP-binding protein
MIGRLYRLGRPEARNRAGELLERFGIADAGDRLVKGYSGGMRRRLDLAASLIAKPSVLFLDEPTTGLDPAARRDLWNLIRELVADGTTVLLTTQYLDEADALADDIVVLDHGRSVAQGSPAELKRQIGGDRLEIAVEAVEDLARADQALRAFADGEAAHHVEERRLVLPLHGPVRLIEIVRALDAAGIDAVDVQRREPTLDDVFLKLVGDSAADETPREVAA